METKFLFIIIPLFFFSGCGVSNPSLGEEGKRCFEDKTCKEGLVCLEDVCRQPSFDCHGRECGLSPNIGHDCGSCPGATEYCNTEGQCVDDCQGRECGSSPTKGFDCGSCSGDRSACDETTGTCFDELCRPDPCNGHGMCSRGVCSCDIGYAGDYCERCAPTYGGYPECTSCENDNGCPADGTCLLGVSRVAAGGNHTCALTALGGVKCWGYNYYGQLGDGTRDDRLVPTDVFELSSNVAAIAAGYDHNCALTTSGGVKCWGSNFQGQLGNGNQFPSPEPKEIPILRFFDVVAIGAGFSHSCAVSSSGRVKCWGWNYFGQLGDGTTTDKNTPTDVTGLSEALTVAAGVYHTCALTSSGSVKCWGSNSSGQLGDGTNDDRLIPTDVARLSSGVVAVAAGGFHACALLSDGGVKCWGENFYGQLGDGTTTSRNFPVDVTGLSSGVVAVTAGQDHTCALTSLGGIKCWGRNSLGQLGNGSRIDSSTPIDVTGFSSGAVAVDARADHTCAMDSLGGIKCWGRNEYGQLGNGTRTTRLTPRDVLDLASGTVAVEAGLAHTCSLSASGGIKCWGNNYHGQLGDGTRIDRSAPIEVSGLTSGVLVVSAGGGHSCAITSSGGVKCWGLNSGGQLGDGTLTDRSTPTDVVGLSSDIVAVAAGIDYTCALSSSGGVLCWGANDFGQLGDGTQIDSPVPVDVAGLSAGVTAITAGDAHTCAITSLGGAKCWGWNMYGQLGDGTTTTRSAPTDVTGLSSGVASITAGGNHTCAVTTSGRVKCWGSNYFGAIGDGTLDDKLTPIDVIGLASGMVAVAAGLAHTCALSGIGGVTCWGLNLYGQLGDGTTETKLTPTDVVGLSSGVTVITAGDVHTCALISLGGVKCWGWSELGQIGDGTSGEPRIPKTTCD